MNLHAEDIDWNDQTLAYARKKTASPALIHFGDEVASILKGIELGFIKDKLRRLAKRISGTPPGCRILSIFTGGIGFASTPG